MRTADSTFTNTFNAIQNLSSVKKLGGNSNDDLLSRDELNAAVNDVSTDPNLREFARNLLVKFDAADQWGAANTGGKAGDNLISINEAFNVSTLKLKA